MVKRVNVTKYCRKYKFDFTLGFLIHPNQIILDFVFWYNTSITESVIVTLNENSIYSIYVSYKRNNIKK